MKTKKVSPCNQVFYGEFPEVLFGKSEDGSYYFDVTLLLERNENVSKTAIGSFCEDMKKTIGSLSRHYSIPPDEMIVLDSDSNHILAEESLVFLFLAYVDPDFLIYMLEGFSGLLRSGFAVSDSMLLAFVKNKFTKEELNTILEA